MGKSTDEFNASYNQIRNAMKGKIGANKQEIDKGEIFWAVLEGAAAIIDGALGTSGLTSGPIASLSNGGMKGIFDIIGARKEEAAIANPWFVWNGHDDLETSYTRQYLKNRTYKGLGGSAIALAGAGVSFVSVVDVGGILQHGNAVGSTAVHLHKFKTIAAQYKETKTISNWLGLIIKLKAMKTASAAPASRAPRSRSPPSVPSRASSPPPPSWA